MDNEYYKKLLYISMLNKDVKTKEQADRLIEKWVNSYVPALGACPRELLDRGYHQSVYRYINELYSAYLP